MRECVSECHDSAKWEEKGGVCGELPVQREAVGEGELRQGGGGSPRYS